MRLISKSWWGLLLLLLLGCQSAESHARFLYLAEDDQGRLQLWSGTLNKAEVTQLTSENEGVFDYAVAPRGDQIAYSYATGAEERTLKLATLRDDDTVVIAQELSCISALCQTPVWVKDGNRVIYERRDGHGGRPRLWWWDVVQNKTLPVFSGEDIVGYNATLSADNRYLAYVSSSAKANEQYLAVFDFETSQQKNLSNLMNTPAIWHPSEHRFLWLDMVFYGEVFGTHIFQFDVTTQQQTDVSNIELTEDGSPAWSADGELIFFGRKLPQLSDGQRLYSMRGDGTEIEPLTSENVQIHYGPPMPSADGKFLIFQRFDLSQPRSHPSIWVMETETRAVRQLVEKGQQPQWLK